MVLTTVPAGAPTQPLGGLASAVEPDRDAAREAARRELSGPEYRSQEPTLFERAVDAFWDGLDDLFGRAGNAAPGGFWSWIVLAGLLAVAVVVIRTRLGPLRAAAARPGEVFTDVVQSAAEHHAAAAAALVADDLRTAVLERFRALVRGLEERGLLEPRPGRTAHEAATEGALVLPGCGPALLAAARTFDEVRYGDRHASRAGHDIVAAADADARSARPTAPAEAAIGWAPPGRTT